MNISNSRSVKSVCAQINITCALEEQCGLRFYFFLISYSILCRWSILQLELESGFCVCVCPIV